MTTASHRKARHRAGALTAVDERRLDKEARAHVLARGICPNPDCPGRPLRLASSDGQQATAVCSCGFSTTANRGTRLYRVLHAGVRS